MDPVYRYPAYHVPWSALQQTAPAPNLPPINRSSQSIPSETFIKSNAPETTTAEQISPSLSQQPTHPCPQSEVYAHPQPHAFSREFPPSPQQATSIFPRHPTTPLPHARPVSQEPSPIPFKPHPNPCRPETTPFLPSSKNSEQDYTKCLDGLLLSLTQMSKKDSSSSQPVSSTSHQQTSPCMPFKPHANPFITVNTTFTPSSQSYEQDHSRRLDDLLLSLSKMNKKDSPAQKTVSLASQPQPLSTHFKLQTNPSRPVRTPGSSLSQQQENLRHMGKLFFWLAKKEKETTTTTRALSPQYLLQSFDYISTCVLASNLDDLRSLARGLANIRSSKDQEVDYCGELLECKKGDTFFSFYFREEEKMKEIPCFPHLKKGIMSLYHSMRDASTDPLFSACLKDTASQLMKYPKLQLQPISREPRNPPERIASEAQERGGGKVIFPFQTSEYLVQKTDDKPKGGYLIPEVTAQHPWEEVYKDGGDTKEIKTSVHKRSYWEIEDQAPAHRETKASNLLGNSCEVEPISSERHNSFRKRPWNVMQSQERASSTQIPSQEAGISSFPRNNWEDHPIRRGTQIPPLPIPERRKESVSQEIDATYQTSTFIPEFNTEKPKGQNKEEGFLMSHHKRRRKNTTIFLNPPEMLAYAKKMQTLWDKKDIPLETYVTIAKFKCYGSQLVEDEKRIYTLYDKDTLFSFINREILKNGDRGELGKEDPTIIKKWLTISNRVFSFIKSNSKSFKVIENEEDKNKNIFFTCVKNTEAAESLYSKN